MKRSSYVKALTLIIVLIVSVLGGNTAHAAPLLSANDWNALISGLNGTVYAIVVNGSDIYVGGQFTNAGGNANANYIAKWDGTSWSALGSGLNGTVYSIALRGTDIYVGGLFTDAGGDTNADYVAQWNGSTWSTLGNGLNNYVNVVAVSGSNVYVAGNFTDAGGYSPADYIAKLDGGTWDALGTTPLTGEVSSAVVVGSFVYVGGLFNNAGGDANADKLALWDGTSWSALGNSGINAKVSAIALNGGDVYVGGEFSNAAGNPNADYIAKWDGTSWSALGSGLNYIVRSIAIDGQNVYAGGYFTNAGGDANADYIARWDGATWSALGTTVLDNAVNRITINGLDLYAGGQFANIGSNSNARRIARYEIDATAPTVNSFAATSPSNSLNIPVTVFTASDNVAITGYLITESDTTPSTGTAGWTTSVPASYAVGSDGTYTLYPWVKDATGNISSLYGSPVTVTVDTTKPTVDSFSATSPSNSLNIPVTAFTASDNLSIVGYIITTSATPPSAVTVGWTASAPTIYTVAGSGSYTLYPWTADAAGNISAVYGSPANVTVDATKPTVTGFSAPSTSASLTISSISFTSSDNVGVTGFMITESTTPPSVDAEEWTVSAPTSFIVGNQGTHTLYPWVKDAVGNVSNVYGSPVTVTVDVTKPTVTSFTVTSPSTSLNVPITAFTASDNVAVSEYLITESSTPPSSGAAGWSASKPTTFTVASQGSHTLYPWVKDTVGNISAIFGSPRTVSVDTTVPTVTAFSAPASSSSLNIPINTFTASDNVGVTGYLITESSTPPSSGAAGWSASKPTTFTVAGQGVHTLYPWAKDAAGYVSSVYGSPASVDVNTTIPDTTAPSVDGFTVVSPSASLDISINSFDASDNMAVTDYLITESYNQPASSDSGWSASVPTTYTVASDGVYTLYPWAKDAAGNVSPIYGSPASVTVDTTVPTVDSFAVTSPSSDLNIPVTAFAVSDTNGVTGYLITESSTQPATSDSGWSASAPTTYTVTSDGDYTLYPWAKDAAGNISAVYGSPASVEVDTIPPGDTTAPSVDTFTTVSTSNSLNISITAFTASDDTAVTAYLITESNVQPASGASGWSASAPSIYTVASDGFYTLYPWAKDAAGNVSAEFGSPVNVTVDTTAPNVTIDSQPTDPSASADASFTFSSIDLTATFECDLDGGGYASCSSPMSYTALSNGSHTFSVRATDTFGNTGAADTYTWTISTYVASQRAKNGGFNTYTGISKIPTSWKAVKFSATDGKITNVKKEGTASVRITGAGVTKTLSQTLILNGSTGDAFTFSFWLKGSSIPSAGICRGQVLLYNGSTLKQTKTVNCPTGTYGFQKKTVTFNASAAYTKVVIKFTYSKASGQVWLDAVSLIK